MQINFTGMLKIPRTLVEKGLDSVNDFANAETDYLAPGSYTYDVRYVINPYYDSEGKIVDGDQVITPKTPRTVILLSTVGQI